MNNQSLNFTLIQSDIIWEDKNSNMWQYEETLSNTDIKNHVVVLPEMFTTGFSMAPSRLAEQMNGKSVKWMKEMAAKYCCILTGSLIIEEGGKHYNRMLWVQPNGEIGCYDKRHLFSFAGEDKHFSAGNTRTIAQVNGWRINLIVCYDLRFPVWLRNNQEEYDVILCVANWPQKRSLAWKTLLQARAIENMCYAIGVNRVGKDGKDNNYSGDSSVFDPLGELLWQQSNSAICHTISLDKKTLIAARHTYPFLHDADKFIIL